MKPLAWLVLIACVVFEVYCLTRPTGLAVLTLPVVLIAGLALVVITDGRVPDVLGGDLRDE